MIGEKRLALNIIQKSGQEKIAEKAPIEEPAGWRRHLDNGSIERGDILGLLQPVYAERNNKE